MTQFYILEIQQYPNGEFGHIVHYAWDENPDTARLKAESKYHQVLSAAAISSLPSHAATLISSEGFPVMNQCYKHEAVEETPAPAVSGGEEEAGEEQETLEEPEPQAPEEEPEQEG